MRPLLFFILICFGLSSGCFAQFSDIEAKIAAHRNACFNTQNIDSLQYHNGKVYDLLNEALKKEGSFEYGFSKLKTISFLASPDEKFRIVSWNLEYPDETNAYFCFIQSKFGHKNYHTLFVTENCTNFSEHNENEIFKYSNWPGAVYYDLIPFRRNGKNAYILLGWRKESDLIQKKVADVLSHYKETLFFGLPVFEKNLNLLNRLVFTYPSNVNFTLTYKPDLDAIVYNRLVPKQPGFQGIYSQYTASFHFDGFIRKRGKWEYTENLDLRSEREYVPKQKPSTGLLPPKNK